jgi:Leucine-rich repeat (LRR) protein
MPALPALTSLDLRDSGLRSLQGMPALPALTSLDLRGSSFFLSLVGMPVLPALTSLDLNGTQKLESRRGIQAVPHLKTIDIRGSASIDLNYLAKLPDLVKIITDKDQLNLSTIPPAIRDKIDIISEN